MTTTDSNTAEGQAKAQLESIKELIQALDNTTSDSTPEAMNARDNAECAIQDDPLSVEVRSDWHTPGEPGETAEYCILLCTGGPACRIIGTLGQFNAPESARLEYHDWDTPWTPYWVESEDEDILIRYAQQFYFGE